MAGSLTGAFMSKRTTRAQIAQETLTILASGQYVGPGGETVDLQSDLASAQAGSVLYRPGDFKRVFPRRDEILRERGDAPPTEFQVVNETTLHAARRLLDEGSTRVLALNFASARNPGGGFLKGSQAQEESLARASGLYACQTALMEMYEVNRQQPSCLYTDHMIYSPDVPFFRDDNDLLLGQPFPVSVLTAPAVNAGAVQRNEPSSVGRIEAVMLARMEKVLSVAVAHGHETLVLGAWGCGVFANDPEQVASWFARHLRGDGLFRVAFRKVVFAVLDGKPGGSTIRHFERLFAGRA
jgi:uncharacterized protein (TIGR02452 family)